MVTACRGAGTGLLAVQASTMHVLSSRQNGEEAWGLSSPWRGQNHLDLVLSEAEEERMTLSAWRVSEGWMWHWD